MQCRVDVVDVVDGGRGGRRILLVRANCPAGNMCVCVGVARWVVVMV